jgi:hypothetical protein
LKTRVAAWASLIAGLILVLVLHAHLSQPPIFDGLPMPQEPYRYVNPPPELASSNLPPEPGEATFPVMNGQPVGGGVQTGDSQVIVFFGVGTLQVSPSAVSVTVRVEPVKNPPPPPPGYQIRGNVYRITAAEQPGGAPATAISYHLTMRVPPGPFKELQFYDGTSWHPLKTNRPPNGDLYAGAALTSLGEVAAVAPAGAGDSIYTVLARYLETYGLLAFILVFGIIAVTQEVRRRRKRR